MRLISAILFMALAIVGVDVLLIASNVTLPYVGGYVSGFLAPFIPATLAPTTELGSLVFSVVTFTSLAFLGMALTGVNNIWCVLFFIVGTLSAVFLAWGYFGQSYTIIGLVNETLIAELKDWALQLSVSLGLAFLVSIFLKKKPSEEEYLTEGVTTASAESKGT